VSNNLKVAYDKAVATAALKQAEIAPATRAEAIPLEAMARLYRALNQSE
jgi:16S rRNA A1518/A1519 N6-dimethyltransferase RsmA/KsgA/DIM1 with predicted DNA glycosylase/AP lyase activity